MISGVQQITVDVGNGDGLHELICDLLDEVADAVAVAMPDRATILAMIAEAIERNCPTRAEILHAIVTASHL
jgi:hypothetical protein